MAIDRGYITLAEFKVYKGSTSTGTTYDALIEDIIEAASRHIDALTRRFFHTSTGQTAYYTPEMRDMLIVDDIYAITTLKTDEDGDGTYENTWDDDVSTGDFWLMPFNSAVLGNSGAYSYNWIEIAQVSADSRTLWI